MVALEMCQPRGWAQQGQVQPPKLWWHWGQVQPTALPHSRDGLDHVNAHLHTAVSVVPARLRQPRHAVVAVPQDLDAQAVVLLGGTSRLGGLQDPPKSPSPSTHRSQLVKAGKELIECHHQFLGRAL